MQNPIISVCVMAYNHEQYIYDCLMSVLSQNVNADIELLVGDDASIDNTQTIVEALIEEFPEKIKYFRHEKNIGADNNFRYLLQKSKGEYIAHLDGDDYWLPGKLKKQLEMIKTCNECVAIYSNALVISTEGEFLGLFNKNIKSYFDLNYLLDGQNFLNYSSMLYRSKYKQDLINVPDKALDYYVHLTLAQNGKIGYLNNTYVAYRFHSESSLSKNSSEYIVNMYWETLLHFYKKDVCLYTVKKSISKFWCTIIVRSLKKFDFRSAIFWTKKIQKESPVSGIIIIMHGGFRLMYMIFNAVKRNLGKLLSGESVAIFYRR